VFVEASAKTMSHADVVSKPVNSDFDGQCHTSRKTDAKGLSAVRGKSPVSAKWGLPAVSPQWSLGAQGPTTRIRCVAHFPFKCYHAYAALSNPRSSASSNATKSDTSHTRAVTPAAIACVTRSVQRIRACPPERHGSRTGHGGASGPKFGHVVNCATQQGPRNLPGASFLELAIPPGTSHPTGALCASASSHEPQKAHNSETAGETVCR
jgi:hypothetical protein